jgi:hypothetical protein
VDVLVARSQKSRREKGVRGRRKKDFTIGSESRRRKQERDVDVLGGKEPKEPKRRRSLRKEEEGFHDTIGVERQGSWRKEGRRAKRGPNSQKFRKLGRSFTPHPEMRRNFGGREGQKRTYWENTTRTEERSENGGNQGSD